MIRLTRLPTNVAIVDGQNASPDLIIWWQEFADQIEASVNGIIAAQEAAAAAQQSADTAQQTADGKQDDSVTLTGLADLPDTLGIVEQTAPDAFNIRALGVSTAASVPTRSTGDTRWVRQDSTPAWVAPTGTASRASFATYTAPAISNPPTQAEVQAIADALQAISQALKAAVDDLGTNGALLV